MSTELEANARVRLTGDPTRIGVTTGRTQPGRRGRGERFQVKFPDMTQWIPGDQLELVPNEREEPVELLRQGKLGRVVDLRRTLTHVRLTGRLADVIYSMETTNTDFYPYQFKPVLRFLHSPSNAFLIADEVGLGKTIEAGLIWTELRSRFDLQRLLVLCPAMLREKWQRELDQKIGVRADIVNAEGLLKRLRDPRSQAHGFAMICSQAGARPQRQWDDPTKPDQPTTAELARFLQSRENDEPLVDLIVIDEAHYLRNPESQTNLMGRLFRPVTEHLLLLSATPIHNYNQDLFTLLRLLDGDTFEHQEDFDRILKASQPLVEARDHLLGRSPSAEQLDEMLRRADAHPLLKGSRQLQATREALRDPDSLADRRARAQMAYRLEMVNPLAYVITRTRKRDVKEWRVVRDPRPEAVPMTPAEENFYEAVTDFVIDYAMERDVNERFILATPQRQMSSSMPATLRAWQQRRNNVDDCYAASRDNEKENDIGPLTREIIERADEFGSVETLMLHDSKYARVEGILTDFFRESPQEKVVLFSTFRETLNYLGERLGAAGISNLVMHGGCKESKESILRRFETDPSIRVLLSSEVGSEGIDLQFCRVLINYDLPWNPMRIEQRIGRLDRLGQKADRILIWNLLYAGTIDARIYTRLYEKLDLCRQALGDFEAVLGDEVRKLTIDLLSRHLSAQEQEARIDQTAQAMENLRQQQEQLESEAGHLVAYGDYILNQVRAAKDMNRRIDGDDLRTYVVDFFKMHYPGCTFRKTEQNGADYEVSLSTQAKQDLDDYIREQNIALPTRLTQSINRPVICLFENRTTAQAAGSVELISQFHPLVRFVSASITASEEQLRPAVCVQLPSSAIEQAELAPDNYVLAAACWSVQGLQTTEKLVFAAAAVGSDSTIAPEAAERLANAAARVGQDWYEGAHILDINQVTQLADEVLFGQLEEDYEAYVADIRRQNEDRADLQLRNLGRHLEQQRRQLTEIREQHRFQGRDSLVKATDGRIQALESRIERRQLVIEQQRSIRHTADEIFVALVRLAGK